MNTLDKIFSDYVEELSRSGLEFWLHTDETGTAGEKLLRLAALAYSYQLYKARIFNLAHVARMLCWEQTLYASGLPPCEGTLMEHPWIGSIHDQFESLIHDRSAWKNPALCSRTLWQLEKSYTTLSLASLADGLHINSSYLSRIISQSFFVSFMDLLQCKRILEAMSAMEHTSRIPLGDLAACSGFHSAHHLYCTFKKYTALSPSEVRRLYFTVLYPAR